jgi:hypothetical protein
MVLRQEQWCFSPTSYRGMLPIFVIRSSLPSWEAPRLPRSLRCASTAVFATVTLFVLAVVVADPATAAVPSSPTGVTARAGDQLAEVTWNAPVPDDPSITGYTITTSPADTPPVETFAVLVAVSPGCRGTTDENAFLRHPPNHEGHCSPRTISGRA